MSIQALRRLNEIITSALDDIDARFSAASLTFPSLDDPYSASGPAEALLSTPDVIQATSRVAAAASQLTASVRHPAHVLIEETYASYVAPCLRSMIEADVVEIVRDAGSKGIHTEEIAKLNGTDSSKTARILRLLSNRYIFKEVSPDVFATNRLSSAMDTGKAVADLRANPADKHVGTSGIPAYICLGADEFMRFASFIPEAYADPQMGHSLLPTETPLNLAFNTPLKFFEWYNVPENTSRKLRFDIAMTAYSKMNQVNPVLSGFDWLSLPEGSIVVDVGGGVGSCSLSIAEHAPQLKFVIEDLEEVIVQGPQFWKTYLPQALETGLVEFKVQDFFEPQPVELQASAYVLRHVLHDWPDEVVKKILRRLREAATPSTKLVVVDIVVPYTCRTEPDNNLPEPLLPSLGPVSNMKYMLDIMMYAGLNAQERTATHFSELAAQSGWKVVSVYNIPGSISGQYVAEPV